MRRPLWRSAFLLSCEDTTHPSAKSTIFERGRGRTLTRRARNTGTADKPTPSGEGNASRKKSTKNPSGRGAAAKRAALLSCVSIFQRSRGSISPPLQILCKGTAFFAHTQARARKKHKKRKKSAFCTIFLCRACRFARKSPI